MKVFYEKMGKTILGPHEDGLRSLFDSIRRELPVYLDRARKARVVFTGVSEFTSDRKLVEASK